MTPGEEQSAWKALGELSTVGMTLVLATVIGLAGGYYLDKWLGTTPWLFLLFFLLGFAAGVLNVVRAYEKMQKEIMARTGGNIGHSVRDDED